MFILFNSALTSPRTYKHAWSNDETLEVLNSLANIELDRDCVEALTLCREKVEEIQMRFQEPSTSPLARGSVLGNPACRIDM